MHQIRFRLRLRPRPRWDSLQLDLRGLLLRGVGWEGGRKGLKGGELKVGGVDVAWPDL